MEYRGARPESVLSVTVLPVPSRPKSLPSGSDSASHYFGTAVFIPIVPPLEHQGRILVLLPQPFLPRLTTVNHIAFVAAFIRVGKTMPLDSEGHGGRQDVEAHVVKRIMGRPENRLDIPSAGTGSERDFRGAGRNGAHRLPAAKATPVMTHRAGVEASIDKNPVKPTLENSRSAVPPDRKLCHHQVRTLQPRSFSPDVVGQCARAQGVTLLTQG